MSENTCACVDRDWCFHPVSRIPQWSEHVGAWIIGLLLIGWELLHGIIHWING